MNRYLQFVTVAALLVCVCAVGADDKPAKLTKTWSGEQNLKIRDQAPKNDRITDKESWEKLWKAFRGDEKVPDVDFTKELVLIACNTDPNRISISAALDDKGDLKVSHISTEIAFNNPTTFKYQFATVSRDGIKTINGKPLAK